MFLDLNTLILPLALLALVVVLGVLVMSLLLPRLRRLRRTYRAEMAAMEDDGDIEYPAVSVIVTAIYDAQALPDLLPALLTQDYPAPMEVIVVSGGDSAFTDEIVQQLQQRFTNLYMTFAPQHSRNVSRRKLAITLGVKASAYDYVLITSGNCHIASPLWLRSMARHFALGEEIVTGGSLLRNIDDDELLPSRTIAFDRERTMVQYMAAAIAGKMYRADGRNMGYAKRLFMDRKGFSETLSMVNGDDDVFVDTISRGVKCGVELSDMSRVKVAVSSIKEEHQGEKTARQFTSLHTRRGTYRLWGFMSWLWVGTFLAALAAIAVSLPWSNLMGGLLTWLPAIAVAVCVTLLMVGICVPVMVSWRKTAIVLGGRPLCLTVPWFMLWHPIYTLKCKMRGRRDSRNYTWQAP